MAWRWSKLPSRLSLCLWEADSCNMEMRDGTESATAVSHICNTGVLNLIDAVEFFYVCSIGRWEGLVGGSAAGEHDVVDKQVKGNAPVIESESKPWKSAQPGDDEETAARPMEDDRGWSDERGIAG